MRFNLTDLLFLIGISYLFRLSSLDENQNANEAYTDTYVTKSVNYVMNKAHAATEAEVTTEQGRIQEFIFGGQTKVPN